MMMAATMTTMIITKVPTPTNMMRGPSGACTRVEESAMATERQRNPRRAWPAAPYASRNGAKQGLGGILASTSRPAGRGQV